MILFAEAADDLIIRASRERRSENYYGNQEQNVRAQHDDLSFLFLVPQRLTHTPT